MDELSAQRGLTDNERMLFQVEFSSKRKSPTAGLMWCLFLGGVGAHHFYMGRVGLGVVYLLLSWTFLPLIAACVEVFLMMGRVNRYNDKLATEIATRLRAYRPSAAQAGGMQPLSDG